MSPYQSIIRTRHQRGQQPEPDTPSPSLSATTTDVQKRKEPHTTDELADGAPTAKKSRSKATVKTAQPSKSGKSPATLSPPLPPTTKASVGPVPMDQDTPSPIVGAQPASVPPVGSPVITQEPGPIPSGTASLPAPVNGGGASRPDESVTVGPCVAEPRGTLADGGDTVAQTFPPKPIANASPPVEPVNTAMQTTDSDLFGDDDNDAEGDDDNDAIGQDNNAAVTKSSDQPLIPTGANLQFPKRKLKLTPLQEAEKKETAAAKRANVIAFDLDMADCHAKVGALCQEYADRWGHTLEDIKLRVAIREEHGAKGTKAPTSWNGYVIATIEDIKKRNMKKMADYNKALAALPSGSSPPDLPDLEPEDSKYVSKELKEDYHAGMKDDDSDQQEAWLALAVAARERKEGVVKAPKVGKIAEREMLAIWKELDLKYDRIYERLGYSTFLIIVPHHPSLTTIPLIHVDPNIESFLPTTCRIPVLQLAQAMKKYAGNQEESVALSVRALDNGNRNAIVTEMENMFKTVVAKPKCKLNYANPWRGMFELHGVEWEGYPLKVWKQPGEMSQDEKNQMWKALTSDKFKFVKCTLERKKALYEEHHLLEEKECDFATHPGIHRTLTRKHNETSLANLKKGRVRGTAGKATKGRSAEVVDDAEQENVNPSGVQVEKAANESSGFLSPSSTRPTISPLGSTNRSNLPTLPPSTSSDTNTNAGFPNLGDLEPNTPSEWELMNFMQTIDTSTQYGHGPDTSAPNMLAVQALNSNNFGLGNPAQYPSQSTGAHDGNFSQDFDQFLMDFGPGSTASA